MKRDMDLVKNDESTADVYANANADENEQLEQSSKPSASNQLAGRYKDAYRVARAAIGVGGLVKVVGVLFFIAGFFGLIYTAEDSVSTGIMLIVAGFVVGTGFYLVGVLVSAQGQSLIASLDGAINTSPFLDDPGRAKIMGIDC